MRSAKVTLIGAGLAGCLLAVYLARRGFSVQIFERRPDMREQADAAGRSINLSLSARAIHALREVELHGKCEAHLVAMSGRMIHGEKSELLYQPYGRVRPPSITRSDGAHSTTCCSMRRNWRAWSCSLTRAARG